MEQPPENETKRSVFQFGYVSKCLFIADILKLSQSQPRRPSKIPITCCTNHPKSTEQVIHFLLLPPAHTRPQRAAVHLDPIVAHVTAIKCMCTGGLEQEDLGTKRQIRCHISIFHQPPFLFCIFIYVRERNIVLLHWG